MRARVLTAAIVLASAAGAACRQPGVFSCADDEACAGGQCEPEGFCSFVDEACDSGRRFGDHAGDGLAGTCVAVGEEGGSETTTTGEVSGDATDALATDTGSESSGVAVEDGSSTGMPEPCTDWWDCAWPVRVPVEVSWPGAPLEQFPIRVALTSERFDFTASTESGADLRVVDDAGRPLPFEIELWDPEASTAEVWVRLPALEDGARIWLYHGNIDAEAAEDPPAVFARDYLAVWHMGPELGEATGAEPLGDAGTSDATGRIGRARGFDGTSAHLRPAPEPALLDVFEAGATLSAWVLVDTFGQGGYGRILDHASVNTAIDGWSLGVAGVADGGTIDTLRFAYGYSLMQGDWRPVATLSPGTWHHVAVAYVAGDVSTVPQFYVDGSPIETVATVEIAEGVPNQATTTQPAIGALGPGASRFFDGSIDELRVSGVVRSPQWIAAEHASDVDEILAFQPPEYAP
jgi:hypothetical protein